MRRRPHVLLASSLALTLAAGCAGDPTGPARERGWVSTRSDCEIALAPAHLRLAVAHSAAEFTVRTSERVTWASLDRSVAFVNATGAVMPIGVGTTAVTVTTASGCSAVGLVTVEP
jgi:hypothetical protein